MIKKIKKHQQLFLIGLIVICMGIMAFGAVAHEQLKMVEDVDSVYGIASTSVKKLIAGPYHHPGSRCQAGDL